VRADSLRSLTFVEPHAHARGGHWQGALSSLVGAATASGVEATAVSVEAVDQPFREELGKLGCRCFSLQSDGSATLKLAVRALNRLEHAARRSRFTRSSRDISSLRRAILEVGLQRLAEQIGADASIVLGAGNAFPALTVGARRVSTPRLHVVHDVDTIHTVGLRRIYKTRSSRLAHVAWMTTTPALAEALSRQGLHATVLPFATRGQNDYLASSEILNARLALGIPFDRWCVGLVGGWWHDKDMETVVRAIERLPSPPAVIVAGEPLTPDLVSRLVAKCSDRVVVMDRALSAREVREVYAASDLTIVSKRSGVVKETGVVMDAVRFGIPVLYSNHDPHLNDWLAPWLWARSFDAGTATSLADAMNEVQQRPLPRPTADDADRLGLQTPVEMLQAMVQALSDLRRAG
jgi:glycosyltransferase involved in cell wall biosynthesis